MRSGSVLKFKREEIPHSRPTLGQEEIQAVADVIASGQVAGGDEVARFENAMAQNCGLAGGVATSSGTAALHLSLAAFGIGPKDEVIIPSFVCTAVLNAVLLVRAKPVLADIILETGNIDPDDVKQKLTKNTRAIIAPHLFGLPADIDNLVSLGIPVIEDCAQAIGAHVGARPVGGMGVTSVFSFYATKMMCTGEGGMVLSDSRKFLEKVRDLHEYDNKEVFKLRYNYKMTDMAGALGLAQLKKLDTFIAKRRAIASRFDEAFKDLCKLPTPADGHVYYRYVIRVKDPARIIRRLREKMVFCARPVYNPLHCYLKQNGYAKTKRLWLEALSIPIYPSLTPEEINKIIDSVRAELSKGPRP